MLIPCLTSSVTYIIRLRPWKMDNLESEQFNYENKSFSFFKDFNQNTEELSSNEQEFLDEIFDQIILDIFNVKIA